MAETENAAATETDATTETAAEQTPAPTDSAADQAAAMAQSAAEEEISYHAVEKEGNVTAIWEMQGRKHLRTIDPRSIEGKHILSLFTSEHHEEAA